MNQTIKKNLDDGEITQEEYNILFEDKSNWLNQRYSSSEILELTDTDFNEKFEKKLERENKYKNYNKALKKVLDIQSKSEKIDLSHIQFVNYYFLENLNTVFNFSNCKFYGTTSFKNNTFHKEVYFDNATFENEADFKNVTFTHTADFKVTTFKDKANFWKTTFNGDANFKYATFHDETIFQHTTFDKVNFSYSKAKSYIDFSESKFQKIDLENSHFVYAIFLNLQNKQGKNLYKENFSNKESTRIIKDHFEKQNNIIESNKYFALEQNKYLEELKKSIHKNHYKDFLVLWINKYVSYFGNDWARPLFVIFSFGFLASFFYILCSNDIMLFTFKKYPIPIKDLLYWTSGGFIISIIIYLFYHFKAWTLLALAIIGYIGLIIFNHDLRLITNDISKLINPLNIFKAKEYFKDIAPYGMFVKLIMATLIYQFIMAFRQNTRRK